MKATIVLVVFLLITVLFCLFVAKSTLNLDTMKFTVERPLTGMLLFCTIIAAMIEEKVIEKIFDLFC